MIPFPTGRIRPAAPAIQRADAVDTLPISTDTQGSFTLLGSPPALDLSLAGFASLQVAISACPSICDLFSVASLHCLPVIGTHFLLLYSYLYSTPITSIFVLLTFLHLNTNRVVCAV